MLAQCALTRGGHSASVWRAFPWPCLSVSLTNFSSCRCLISSEKSPLLTSALIPTVLRDIFRGCEEQVSKFQETLRLVFMSWNGADKQQLPCPGSLRVALSVRFRHFKSPPGSKWLLSASFPRGAYFLQRQAVM